MKWIRVEDKLPSNEEPVWVHYGEPGTKVFEAFYSASKIHPGGNWCTPAECSYCEPLQGVSHWRPIVGKPEAPK